jgi:hypothetical protein
MHVPRGWLARCGFQNWKRVLSTPTKDLTGWQKTFTTYIRLTYITSRSTRPEVHQDFHHKPDKGQVSASMRKTVRRAGHLVSRGTILCGTDRGTRSRVERVMRSRSPSGVPLSIYPDSP